MAEWQCAEQGAEGGAWPAARLQHSACETGDGMIVAMGRGNSGRYLGDAYLLRYPEDHLRCSWCRLRFRHTPHSVRGTTLVSWRGRILLLTGSPDAPDTVMHLYALESAPDGSTDWRWLPSGGDLPACRIGHSVCVLGSSPFLVVFGGVDTRSRRALRGTHILDLEELEWLDSSLVEGDEPSPRSEHSAVSCSDDDDRGGRMLLFGGATENSGHVFSDLHELTVSHLSSSSSHVNSCTSSAQPRALWRRVILSEGSTEPTPRAGHAAAFAKNQSSLVVLGGGDGKRGIRQAAAFNINTKVWHEPWNQSSDPPFVGEGATLLSRYCGAGEEALIAFGGYNGQGRARSDVHILRLPPLENQEVVHHETDALAGSDAAATTAAAEPPREGHENLTREENGKEEQLNKQKASYADQRLEAPDKQGQRSAQHSKTSREIELEEEVKRLKEEAEQRNARLEEKDKARERLEQSLEEQRNKALRAEAEAAEHARKAERASELEYELERLRKAMQTIHNSEKRSESTADGSARRQNTEGFLSWLGLISSTASDQHQQHFTSEAAEKGDQKSSK